MERGVTVGGPTEPAVDQGASVVDLDRDTRRDCSNRGIVQRAVVREPDGDRRETTQPRNSACQADCLKGCEDGHSVYGVVVDIPLNSIVDVNPD